MAGFKLNWKGDVVVSLVKEAMLEIVADIGVAAEAESRLQLYAPKHGLISGDLRRSVHVAKPSHRFAGENGKADLGGERVLPEQISESRYALALGSGLVYAMAIHQGWPLGYPGLKGTFAGYHYISIGVDKAKKQVKAIVLRHRVR